MPVDVSREELRRLSVRLEHAREAERARVARELHDELGQMLTSLKLEVDALIHGLVRPGAAPDVAIVNRLQAILGLTEVAIETVRRVTADLRPPALDYLGLREAIEGELIKFHARTRIRHRFVVRGEEPEMDVERRTALFRIFQEALTNVARHSDAGAVVVTLARTRGGVALKVQDNGRGITSEMQTSRRSVGLLGMRERAAPLGGRVRIAGAKGRGTTVLVEMPLKGPSD